MSSSEPEPSDLPPPPKRLRKTNTPLSKQSSEEDLWDIDIDSEPSPPAVEKLYPSREPPAPPKSKAPQAIERSPRPLPASPLGAEPNVRRSAVSTRKTKETNPSRRAKPLDDIGELEASDAPPQEPALPSVPDSPPHPAKVIAAPPVAKAEEELIVPDSHEDETALESELSPPIAVEVDHRPISARLKLSKLEKIGLAALACALIATGIFLLTTTFSHIQTQSDRAEKPSFPIKGSHVRILNAGSYWRDPIRSGPGAETVRRETKLLPVLTLELDGGPCAIRAFFRNDQGDFIGDGVTRSASSGTLEIPATAGLDDLGAHAAYRTGETKPWKIEVFEAPSLDSPRQEFKKLLDLTISTDRR